MNKTGFGFLRLPKLDGNDDKSVDYAVLNGLVDAFLERGGDYFDTAYTYLGGVSEEALRRSVVERYPRERFRIADKLPGYKVKEPDQCRDFFEESLRRCGVDYFDVYMLHWLNERNYAKAQKLDEFGFLRQLKAEGKARKTGFSYHDSPELLDRILTDHPEVDIVQLQINYLDWDSPALQARRCYETAVRHGKRVVIMEPVKGGRLASVPEEAERLLRGLDPARSAASWAIRFAAELDQVDVVLSGMNAMEQVTDNMRDQQPLSSRERETLAQVAEIIRAQTAIGCTGCGYCAPNCPVDIPIPRYLALYNDYAGAPADDWKMQHAYDSLAKTFVRASACVGCKNCENNCPQKLDITAALAKTAAAFEK